MVSGDGLTILEYRFVGPEVVWARLGVGPEAFGALAREFGVTRLDVFGSILREDFSAESDVDFLATFDTYRPRPHSDVVYEVEKRLIPLAEGWTWSPGALYTCGTPGHRQAASEPVRPDRRNGLEEA